ncbi:hypothetical protein J4204_06420 [Candidatus Woesearchaeota archaeon]|nr:hypothetical protein [Candidatus Woesearchaeota archaeon]
MKRWIKETARDLFAFGSIPFYFLVVVRAVIGKYNVFVYQMIIAAIFAIVVFTSIFYDAALYTFFAGLVFVLLLVSAYYLKRKISPILRGIIIGALSCIAGYYGAVLV